MRSCAGIGKALTSKPSCHCWPPTWGTVLPFRLTTISTSSNPCERPQVNGLPSTTALWSTRSQRGRNTDERVHTEPPGGDHPRLLHGSPAQASRVEPSHHTQLPRQHRLVAPFSFRPTRTSDHAIGSDRRRSARCPGVSLLPGTGTEESRAYPQRSPLGDTCLLPLRRRTKPGAFGTGTTGSWHSLQARPAEGYRLPGVRGNRFDPQGH